jgi:hypothetical protein
MTAKDLMINIKGKGSLVCHSEAGKESPYFKKGDPSA